MKKYFVSEASVYRLLKAHDLITSPAFIVVTAADEFKDKTTAPNQLWQTWAETSSAATMVVKEFAMESRMPVRMKGTVAGKATR